jgi:polysaccharide export outer membrane protein
LVGAVPGARGLRQLAVALNLVVFPASCVLAPAVAGQEPSSPREGKSRAGAYALQRGDELDIRVFNVKELDQTVVIRPDGRISVLLLDNIEAAGMTIPKLDEIITARYAEFYRDPQVTINVRSFANQKVYVGGEVQHPGMFTLSGELTAARAVLQAGGFKRSAKLSEVILLRNDGNGQPVLTKLNLLDVLNRGKADVALTPFDVVYVPRSRIARIDDFIELYIRQVVPINVSAGFSYLLNNPLVDTTKLP